MDRESSSDNALVFRFEPMQILFPYLDVIKLPMMIGAPVWPGSLGLGKRKIASNKLGPKQKVGKGRNSDRKVGKGRFL